MKRQISLLLALAAITALLCNCAGGGEEEEAATLAVAFRLDEGSPVMVAYIGDPVEDPFQLPAGRYYIEALDEDDVLLSLGAVDIGDGDVVDFPPSFEAAGGVTDAAQADPVITIASFLIDVELAELTFWEIVTGGFTESPFDPAVELDADAFQSLFEMYGDIVEQGDAVLEALYEIDGRAEVLSSASYVGFPWFRDPKISHDLKVAITLLVLLPVVVKDYDGGKRADAVLMFMMASAAALDTEVYKGSHTPGKSEGLLDKKKKWMEYAKTLGDDLTSLENKIKSDLKQLLPGATDKQIDDWAKSDLNEIMKALGKPSSPPVSSSTPMGVISVYWQGMGCSGSEVQGPLAALNECLSSSADAGFSFSQILERCSVSQFEPPCLSETTEEPEPSPSPSPSLTPTPTGTPTPEPTETPTPTSEATATLTPAGQQVRAEGPLLGQPHPNPDCKYDKDWMWLTFSTEGGLVTGAADLVSSCTLSERGTTCDRVSSSFHLEFVGTYSPDTNTLDGTYNERQDDEIETWTADESDECTTEKESRIVSGTWGATLRDGVVMASYGSPRGMLFELTVQGQ